MPYEMPTPESAPVPSIDEALGTWEQRLNRLQNELDAKPDMLGQGYPEWWHTEDDPKHLAKQLLRQEDADLGRVGDFYALHAKEIELQNAATPYKSLETPLRRVVTALGQDVFAKAFKREQEDGILHAAMLDHFKAEDSTDMQYFSELDCLRNIYGVQTRTELLGIGDDPYSEELRGAMLKVKVIDAMRLEDNYIDYSKTVDIKEQNYTWMASALQTLSGIKAEEAKAYVYSASRKGYTQDIATVLRHFSHFGADRIRNIANATGIHGLEGYDTEQLSRMEELVMHPEEEAERLKNHDVTVAFINRPGDHNGVMKDVAASIDDDKARTLFFEIASLRDIYRYMNTLNNLGIRPSTLVLAAHSNEGQFMVSDTREAGNKRRDIASVAGRKLIEMAQKNDELDPGDRAYSMHGMTGMARLVEDYMQPNRAIDDGETDKGRKKIIFQACYAATETTMKDRDDSGKKVEIGTDSVISRLGQDLIKSGVTSSVDIYGADTGMQMHRSVAGVTYSGNGRQGNPRVPIPAHRVRIERGGLAKAEVDEISLRKVA